MSYCIELIFTIPANTTANVSLPIKKPNGASPTWSGPQTINWGDSVLNHSIDMTNYRTNISYHVYLSGTYTITINGILNGWSFVPIEKYLGKNLASEMKDSAMGVN